MNGRWVYLRSDDGASFTLSASTRAVIGCADHYGSGARSPRGPNGINTQAQWSNCGRMSLNNHNPANAIVCFTAELTPGDYAITCDQVWATGVYLLKRS